MPFEIDIEVPLRHGDGEQRRYALVIGVGRYADPRLVHLPYSVADAERLAAILTSHGYQVTTLCDARASARAIRAALGAMIDQADEDDVLLIYFVGHGTLVKGKPYLLLAATPSTPAGITERGLALGELLSILHKAPRWVAVFLDACHMGIGLDPKIGESVNRSAARDGGFALLAASTPAQKSQDTAGSGIFSKLLREGLAGAAAEPDGTVRFSAIARYIQSGVAAWRESSEGLAKLAAQTPVLRLEISDLVLIPSRGYVQLASSQYKITAAAFTLDGSRLATASEDCSVQLWDPATGGPVLAPMRHQHYVGGVAFSRDGILLASCSSDGQVGMWQAPGANEVGPWPPPLGSIATKVALSPDRTLLAVSSGSGVHLYALDSIGRALALPRVLTAHAGFVWAVAFLGNRRLASAGEDRTVRIWDLDAGACIAVLPHDGPVWAVAATPDGRYLAAGGRDPEATPELVNVPRIWDLGAPAPQVIQRFAGHRGGVTAVDFSPQGDRLATASYDGQGRVFRVSDGTLLCEVTVDVPARARPPQAYAAVFQPPRGERLFVGFADGRGRIFDIAPRRR